MKVRIEIDDDLEQTEIVIRTKQLSPEIETLQGFLSQSDKPPLTFYKGDSEYFLSLETLLFFETDGSKLLAHTKDKTYDVKRKLYELEEYLPAYFCRIAKSTIVNVRAVYSLDKSFSGTSRIRFYDTHKQVHVSRDYYHLLKEKLREMR